MPRIEPLPFGGEALLYQMRNKNGLQVDVTNLGASITALYMPDAKGAFDDIVLGYDTAADYLAGDAHIGAVAGRFAGRISGGKVAINDQEYQLSQNNGEHHLHGGSMGFNKHFWAAETSESEDSACIKLSLVSPNGDEGYPGRLGVTVAYTLTDDDALIINYTALSDQITIYNPTQHSYFNMGGHRAGSLDGHEVTILADHYLPQTGDAIPTGEIATVAGTPMDFRKSKPLTEDIDADFPAIKQARGFDHQWVMQGGMTDATKLVAEVSHRASGRSMQVTSDAPGVVLYTANMMPEGVVGKQGAVYGARHGFCLETQGYQDAPNHPNFPSCVINSGELWQSQTTFTFKVSS